MERVASLGANVENGLDDEELELSGEASAEEGVDVVGGAELEDDSVVGVAGEDVFVEEVLGVEVPGVDVLKELLDGAGAGALDRAEVGANKGPDARLDDELDVAGVGEVVCEVCDVPGAGGAAEDCDVSDV